MERSTNMNMDGLENPDSTDVTYKQMRNQREGTINQNMYDNEFLNPLKQEHPLTQSSPCSDNLLEEEEDSQQLSTREEYSNLASEYREAFYTFQQALQKSTEDPQAYNLNIRKNINIKTQNLMDLKALTDFFERQLFKHSRNPKQVRKNWSEDETTLLISMVSFYCLLYKEDYHRVSVQGWQYLEKIFPGKRQDQLKLRWQSILKVPLNKSPWSQQEDDMLMEIVNDKGTDHWRDITLELNSKGTNNPFRQGKQCRERWVNHLDPKLKRGDWKRDEDLTLLREFVSFGKKWSEIAKSLPGRTENSVKNRWVSLLKKYKSEMNVEAIRDSETFDEEDVWNSHIAKALIEARERDLSAVNSTGSEERSNPSSSAKEFFKPNSFMTANSKQSSLEKMEKEAPNFDWNLPSSALVPQDSFKDLIEWQKVNPYSSTVPPTEVQNIPSQGVQNVNSDISQLSVGSEQRTNDTPSYPVHRESVNYGGYPLAQQPQPQQPSYYPYYFPSGPQMPMQHYSMPMPMPMPMSMPFYPQGPYMPQGQFPMGAWGPQMNFGMNPQMGMNMNPQMSVGMNNYMSFGPTPLQQNFYYPQRQASATNVTPLVEEPQKNPQFRETPTAHTKPEQNASLTNPNLYFAMVDRKNNEIFYMNQVTQKNYDNTVTAAANKTQPDSSQVTPKSHP